MIDPTRYGEVDSRSLWHPYTRHSAAAAGNLPVIVRGEGIYLFDSTGRRYVDAISSWWACGLGHGHPRLVAAITRQAHELQHSILGNLTHPRAIELAALVTGLFPDDRRVLFASDGSCAVEAALKVALQYWANVGRPEKNRFVALDFAYHGDTLGAVSVGYLPQFHRPFQPALFPVFQAPSPCCGTCAIGLQSETCLQECFDTLRQIVHDNAHAIAAIIVEPLCQCAGGMRIYAADYLRKLAALCAEHGVLLIADEIAVGLGRTGRMLACEHAGIWPDIVCLGKNLSGGYLPISAAVVREPIYATFGDQPHDCTFYHGHTFTGNPIAAACAVAALQAYREENVVAHAADMGRLLAQELAPLARLAGVRNVRSLGLIGVVELTDEGGRGSARASRIRDRLRGEGVLLRPLGPVIYVMPPLIVSAAELHDLMTAVGQALRTTE